jgi:DNA N-6-adenine-methyltransferase Dam
MSEWERPGESDEWHTPAYIFEAMHTRFDVDVAAPREGPRHVPADRWIYKDQESSWSWNGFIFMNPPFGGRNGILSWLDTFVEHGNGVALTPDRTSAPWFQKTACRVDRILFISPKVKFERPDGTIGQQPGCGTALMSIGSRGNTALLNAKFAGLGLLVEPSR